MIGLTPEPSGSEFLAVQQFINELRFANWNDPQGPIRFSRELKLSELAGAPLFTNVRLLLSALAAEGGTDATATGNLTRAFTARLYDRLALSENFREITRRVCKVINEQDVWPLHRARVVGEAAGFLKRRGKRFSITKLGRELLPDERAGELYRALFLAYFRRFNFEYDFHLRSVPAIQQTLAAILWRLDAVIRDWRSMRGLAQQTLLPRVREQLLAAMRSEYDKEEWIFGGYVLEPLIELGLIEKRERHDWHCTEEDSVRLTPLWPRFISFAWRW